MMDEAGMQSRTWRDGRCQGTVGKNSSGEMAEEATEPGGCGRSRKQPRQRLQVVEAVSSRLPSGKARTKVAQEEANANGTCR